MEFDPSLSDGEFYLVDSLVFGNNVSFYAVISSFYYSSFNLHFFNCNISNNFGTSVGAAIAALNFGGNTFFNRSTFAYNYNEGKSFYGGGGLLIYAVFSVKFYVTNCSFLNNFSKRKGAGILVLAGQLFDSDSFYGNNTSTFGAGLATLGYSTVYTENGVFYNNIATISGGAMFLENFNCTILNSNFCFNHATFGAAINIDLWPFSAIVLIIFLINSYLLGFKLNFFPKFRRNHF